MKNILVLTMVILAVSVFAQPYSKSKQLEMVKNEQWDKLSQYAYNAQISDESGYIHADMATRYVVVMNKKHNVTVQQIDNYVNKFAKCPKIDQVSLKQIKVRYYGICGFQKEAIALAKEIKRPERAYQFLGIYAKRIGNSQLQWKYNVYLLTMYGGYNNVDKATQTLYTMFRYKPKSITKQQQIEFLEQIAQIYPIPGTDFSKWKTFMGFVGFKYKQLTGKDLF